MTSQLPMKEQSDAPFFVISAMSEYMDQRWAPYVLRTLPTYVCNAKICQSQSQSQSYITTDGQSASMSWCRAQSGTFDQRYFFFCIRGPDLYLRESGEIKIRGGGGRHPAVRRP
jgi:hypothetical protein